MKVLSIGNELTCDIHSFVPRLLSTAGEKLLLANLYCDGASVEDHYRNYIDENEIYFYSSFLPGETEPISPDGIALHEAVEDEEWDIVTIQQNTALSGDIESYRPYLAETAAYIKLMIPDTKILLIEPWAYESGRSIKDFEDNYNSDQDKMYDKIYECCLNLKDEAQLDGIIPIGRAWQTLRNTQIGDKLTDDGIHANELGKFLSSCCFYKAITGKNTAENDFQLPDYDKRISDLIKLCADSAF